MITKEELIQQKIKGGERQEIKEIAKASFDFVRKGGDLRDLPKELKI